MGRTQPNDRKGLLFIRNFFLERGTIPSLRIIAAAMGYASPRSAQQMVDRLRNQGFVGVQSGKLVLLESVNIESGEETVEIPLVGNVPCGSLSLAEQQIEGYATISTKIARPGSEYFLLRARGDSMDLSGINDGDIVLVKKQPTADIGDRVVALVDREATIKHFDIRDGCVVLRPRSSNKDLRPIVLSDELIIQGVVVQTIPDVFDES